MFLLSRIKPISSLNPLKTMIFHRTVCTTSTRLSEHPRPIKFTQKDFDKVHHHKFKTFRDELDKNISMDPFSPVKNLIKALSVGFVLATVCSISYGAYDSGYRKVLRTTYPFAAWILDLLMKKEEETVLRDDQISEQAASSTFMDQLKKPNSSKPV